MIEVLVVISVIGILMSILLPAVLSTHEAARSTTCRSRLRQIGIALHSYQTDFQVFPPATFGMDLSALPIVRVDAFSAYARLLPYLDKASVHRQINWSADGANITTMISGEVPTLGELICPSTPQPNPRGASFGFSLGALPGPFGPVSPLPEELIRLTGAFPSLVTIGPQHFRDGLSQTIGMSEIRMGSGASYDPSQNVALVSVSGSVAVSYPDFWVNQCSTLTPPISSWTQRGELWLVYRSLLYNHILPPNTHVVDCAYQPDRGLLSSRSYHHNKVHALLMDGAVRSIANAIDARIWWALGTRIGQDSPAS